MKWDAVPHLFGTAVIGVALCCLFASLLFRRSRSSRFVGSISVELSLILVSVGTVFQSLPLLSDTESRTGGLLLILGLVVVASSLLTVRLNRQSGGAPAIELHWGGFGGGVQGLQVRPHGFLGLLSLLGAAFWMSAAYATLVSNPQKPVVGHPSPNSAEPLKLKVDPIKLELGKSERIEIGPLTIAPFELPTVRLGKLKLEVAPLPAVPVKVEPIAVNSVTVNPIEVKPIQVEPIPIQPVKVNPIAVDPITVLPVDVNSVKVEAIKVQPIEIKATVPPCPPLPPGSTQPQWCPVPAKGTRR